MGRADTVPRALEAEGIPDALRLLRSGITAAEIGPEKEAATQTEDDAGEFVSLHTRALPLIELLEAAYKNDVIVMWEQRARSY
ncbi:DUF1840 family protein [Congregibacter sp.]|jgi:hypothetical protein|uniref:DUF1840 family protein n=1 Tax=Congregibacter sp. TaxID=2744308 RepID=UPI0039E228AD